MAIQAAYQRRFSPGRSLAEIGLGGTAMEGLPKAQVAPTVIMQGGGGAAAAGGGGMTAGATNIMMPLANLAGAGTQGTQYVNPFAGAQFPIISPANITGPTYNITNPSAGGGGTFDWAKYIQELLAGQTTTGDVETEGKQCDSGFHKDPATGQCVPDQVTTGGCNRGFHKDAAGNCVADQVTTGDQTGYTLDQSAFNRLFEAAGGTGAWGSFENWFRAPRGQAYNERVAQHFADLKKKPDPVTQPTSGGRGGTVYVEKPGERAAHAKAQSDAQKKVEEIKNKTSTKNLAARITKTATPTKPATPPFVPYTPPKKKVVAPPVARPTTVKQGGVGVGTFRKTPGIGRGWTGGF